MVGSSVEYVKWLEYDYSIKNVYSPVVSLNEHNLIKRTVELRGRCIDKHFIVFSLQHEQERPIVSQGWRYFLLCESTRNHNDTANNNHRKDIMNRAMYDFGHGGIVISVRYPSQLYEITWFGHVLSERPVFFYYYFFLWKTFLTCGIFFTIKVNILKKYSSRYSNSY